MPFALAGVTFIIAGAMLVVIGLLLRRASARDAEGATGCMITGFAVWMALAGLLLVVVGVAAFGFEPQ